MTTLRKIENGFNHIFRFPKEDRMRMYEIMEVQLDAGLSLKAVFETLYTDIKLTPETSAAAIAGYHAIEQGRAGTAGFTDCNLIPQEEALLLLTGEKKDVLIDVLRQIQGRSATDTTFLSGAITPNSYYLVIAGVLFAMSVKVEDFASTFGGFISMENNPAYQMSVAINDYFMFGLCISIISILSIWFCAWHWYNPLRRFCLYFATDAQLQNGVKFTALSRAFYSIGATHSDILSAALAIYGGSGFMRGALVDLRKRYEDEGDAYNVALGDTVLLPAIARGLAAMTPGEERVAFEKAHMAAERVQISLIKKRHSKAKLLVQFGLLGAISYMLLTMLIGLYSLYDV